MRKSFKESAQWDALINILIQGEADSNFKPLLWVGAGLSVDAGYPTTNKLIEQLRSKSIRPLHSFTPWDTTLPPDSPQSSFTHWVNDFVQKNSKIRLSKSLANIFVNLSNKPTETHIKLVNMPFKSIFTTNYDELLESAFRINDIKYSLITHENNIGLEQEQLISLYKLHGGIVNIKDWTFDEDSYLNFNKLYPLLAAHLKTMTYPHSIIYIGCSMLDPRIINWYRSYEEQSKLHELEYSITIIRKEDWEGLPSELKKLYNSANVHPLLFEDFSDLPLLVDELSSRIDTPEQTMEIVPLVLDSETQAEREAQLIEDYLYEILAPRIIGTIACIWLNTPSSDCYLNYLRSTYSARARIKGELAFNSLQDEFVKLNVKLIGKQSVFSERKVVFEAIDSILRQSNFTLTALKRTNYDPHALYSNLVMSHNQPEIERADDATKILYDKLLKQTCEVIVDCSRALPPWTESNLVLQLEEPKQLFESLIGVLTMWHESNDSHIDEASQIEEEYLRAVSRRFSQLQIFGINSDKRTREYQLSVAYISLTTKTDLNDSSDSTVLSSIEALTKFERVVILGDAGQGKTTLLQWLTVQCGRKYFTGENSKWNQKIPVLIKLREVLGDVHLPMSPDFYSIMVENIQAEQPHKDWFENILANQQAIIMIDGFDEVPNSKQKKVVEWITTLSEEYAGNQIILTSRPSSFESTSLNGLNFQEVTLQPMNRKSQQEFVEHWHQAIAIQYDKLKPKGLSDECQNLIKQLNLQQSLRNLAENPLLCGVICMLHHDRSGYLPKNKVELYEATTRMFLDSRDREKKVIEDEAFMPLHYRDKQSFLCEIAQKMTTSGKTSIAPEQLIKIFEKKLRDMPSINEDVSAQDLKLFFLKRSGLLQEVSKTEVQFAHRSFQEFFTAEYFVAEKAWELLKKYSTNSYWHGTIQLAIAVSRSKSDNEKFLASILQKAKQFEKNKNSAATSLYLLVLRCREYMMEITPTFEKKLNGIITQLIPPTNNKVCDAIAEAGELALPYLNKKSNRKVEEDYYSALALIKIGTADAYVRLIDYFKDERQEYINKVCGSIKFMSEEIAQETRLAKLMIDEGVEKFPIPIRNMIAFLTQTPLLANFEGHTEVHIERWEISHGTLPLRELDPKILNNLIINNTINEKSHCSEKVQETNTVNNKGKVSHNDNLNFLENLTQLTSLKYTGRSIEGISAISNLNKLIKLELIDTNIDDLHVIDKLKQLRYLNLSYTKLVSLTPLLKLTNLEHLNLSQEYLLGITKLQEKLTPISNIFISNKGQQLTVLEPSAPDRENINDISSLQSLIKLKSLNLAGLDIKNLSPLSMLKSLEHLDISILNTCESHDVPQGLAVVNLESLRVINKEESSNELDSESYNVDPIKIHNSTTDGKSEQPNLSIPIDKLTKLKSLNLAGLQLNDYKSLTELVQLKELNLAANPLAVFTRIEEMEDLKRSLNYLSNNDVLQIMEHQKLYLLAKGHKLENFYNTNTFDLSPLSELLQLEYLNLSNVVISDLSPLTNLTQLKHLDLSQYSNISIDGINNLINGNFIESKYLSKNRGINKKPMYPVVESVRNLIDIAPLSTLKQLQHLNLAGIKIQDLSPLLELNQLSELDLSYSDINDFTPLASLPNLKTLYLKFTNSTKLNRFRALSPNCKVITS